MKIMATISAIVLVSGCAGTVTEDEEYESVDYATVYQEQFRRAEASCKASGGRMRIERQRTPRQCLSRSCLPSPGDTYRCER